MRAHTGQRISANHTETVFTYEHIWGINNIRNYITNNQKVLSYRTFSYDTNVPLKFKNCVKEIIWQFRPHKNRYGLESHVTCPVSMSSGTIGIKFNGKNRIHPQDYRYFTRNQIVKYHTGYGSTIYKDGIGVYSFALNPEEQQPSGTCNFSRVDSTSLILKDLTIKFSNNVPTADTDMPDTGDPYMRDIKSNSTYRNVDHDIDVYAVSYNVLRIMSGMGGLVYS